jgi:hypothetical protein
MAVVVRLEPLGVAWGKIDVGLEVAAEGVLHRPAQGRQRRQPLVHLPQRDGGAGVEQLIGARQVDSAGLRECVVVRLQLAGCIYQEHVRMARRAGCQIPVDRLDAEQRAEFGRVLPRDQQRLLLVIVLEEYLRRDGLDQPLEGQHAVISSLLRGPSALTL